MTPRSAALSVAATLALSAVAGFARPAAAAAAGPVALKLPSAAALERAPASVPDALLGTSSRRLLAAAASWGGTFTASSGEQIHIQVSDSYPQDPAVPQRWANFLASLVHGSEISTVQLYLAPLSEVQRYCGRDALACYSPVSHQLVAPGDDPGSSISAEAILTHEYGHHVAASRSDAPWAAVDYGTKRWSSYEQVCARTRTGQLFPGAEDQNYSLNPGEAFAESYRVLNERKLGVPETEWDIVTRALYPDDTALSLLEQDVVSPWVGNTPASVRAVLTRKGRVRSVNVATPLDGTIRITAHATRGERVRLQLLSTSGSVVSSSVLVGTGTRSVSGTVCGARTTRVRLTLLRGSGRVTLATSRP